PEFLREGHAVADTLTPARIVAGVRSARAETVLGDVYRTLLAAGTPLLVTDLATAELAKAAANAFLATKISFINAMAEVCEAAGADLAGGSLAGRPAGVLGASFKPGSDDIRDSPALAVAAAVSALGARVTLYDPAAADHAAAAYPQLATADSAEAAARDADVL